MNEFLANSGYKHWNTKTEQFGEYKFVTEQYQKRVDGDDAWSDTYLCKCNDKLSVNIEVTTRTDPSGKYVSWTIYLMHQSPVNGEWCDLKIYNLPMDKMNGVDLKKLETTLRNMWIAFNKED